MSGTGTGTDTSTVNGTTIVSGPNVIQVSDFYVKAGILRPVTVGSIAVIVLFACLRIGSNRSIAPLTTFDWLMNVALGSTLAGFQFVTSILCARFPHQCERFLQARPLVVAFRGMMLTKVMKDHRISAGDVYCALRQHNVLNISQVECAIIEPNGAITIITTKEVEDSKVEPEVLTWIPAYRALCQAQAKEHNSKTGDIERDTDIELSQSRGQDSDALNLAATKSS